MNPLRALQEQGQSFWLDYISRELLTSGELKQLVEEDGLRGLTSNPTIFQKAITGSADYDDSIRRIQDAFPDADEHVIYERLALEDIQTAADVLRPVFESSGGSDGFVSLEISPHLANDTDGTIVAVLDHWRTVARPNLMVKVPATPEGVPAVTELIAQGVNINVTLMFSQVHYEAVANAYIRGLERAHKPGKIASVASFFVSRVDSAVDKALEAIGSDAALALRGEAAVANGKLAYKRFTELFHGERFAELQSRGAHVQRVLWGSTSTKNPAYSDVKYVDELIGSETVNTMPLDTINAFRDHGHVASTLSQGTEEAEQTVNALQAMGIDLNEVGEQLQKDGVKAFIDSHDALLRALREKCVAEAAAV